MSRFDNSLTRRSFLGSALGAVAAACSSSDAPTEPTNEGPSRLQIRARKPSRSVSVGTTEIVSGERRAILRVPPTYRADEALPLVIAFHGGGGSATDWVQYPTRTDAARMIFLAPESKLLTWDRLVLGFGEDVAFTNIAIAETLDRCNVDVNRVALMGFSEGATYALGLGLANGDRVRSVVAHSPGMYIDVSRHGAPAFFISHGADDPIFPSGESSGFINTVLKTLGYSVEFAEFAGGHEMPAAIQDRAVAWLKTRFG